MYKDDALTRYTREAGQRIMMLVMSQPQGMRSEVVQGALESIQPGLHAKVDRLAGKIAAEGVASLLAYQEALRLSLADVFVNAVKALGRAKETGRLDDEALQAQQLFYGELHPLPVGLGDLDEGMGNAARDAGRFALNLLRSAACSNEVKTAVTGAISSGGARTATSAGMDVARGVSACSRLPGATPAAPAAAPPPPSFPEPSSGSSSSESTDRMTTYLLAGTAVLGFSALLFFAVKRRKGSK